jgi:hypothetical protein
MAKKATTQADGVSFVDNVAIVVLKGKTVLEVPQPTKADLKAHDVSTSFGKKVAWRKAINRAIWNGPANKDANSPAWVIHAKLGDIPDY